VTSALARVPGAHRIAGCLEGRDALREVRGREATDDVAEQSHIWMRRQQHQRFLPTQGPRESERERRTLYVCMCASVLHVCVCVCVCVCVYVHVCMYVYVYIYL
jgi:hypothetical protein